MFNKIKSNFDKNFFFFNLLPSILFILLPILIISGPFLSDFAISIIAVLFIIKSFHYDLKKYFTHKIVLILFFFFLYIFLNSIFQNQNFDSIKISIFYFRFFIFSIAIWHLLEINNNLLKYLFISFVACFSILIIDGFYQYFFKVNLLGQKIYHPHRVSSLFGEELVLGSYLSRLFPIFFGITIYLFKKKNKINIYIVSILFILTDVLVFFSGERTAFFYVNFSAVVMILMLNNFKLARLSIFIMSLFIIFILTIFDDTGKKRIFDETLKGMNLVQKDSNLKPSSESKIYVFSKQHSDHYMSATKIFLDNKFFGVGVKNFRYFCKNEKYNISDDSCSTHPHNTYLQLLSETGIVGFLFFFLLFLFTLFKCLVHFYTSIKKQDSLFNDLEVCLISAILITLWPIAPSGNFFNNWLNTIYYFPLGILLWSRSNRYN